MDALPIMAKRVDTDYPQEISSQFMDDSPSKSDFSGQTPAEDLLAGQGLDPVLTKKLRLLNDVRPAMLAPSARQVSFLKSTDIVSGNR